MDLATFAVQAKNIDADTFCRIHPTPALILAPPRVESKSLGDHKNTPAPLDPSEETGMFPVRPITPSKPTPLFLGPTPVPGSSFTRESAVIFLEKTQSNPFSGMITLGRAENNDIVLKDESISKIHAIFTPPKTESAFTTFRPWRISDRGSTNGTILDGYKLEPDAEHTLSDGSIIAIGPRMRAVFFMPPGLYSFLELFREGRI